MYMVAANDEWDELDWILLIDCVVSPNDDQDYCTYTARCMHVDVCYK